jgi:uncharacterized protein (TIGR03118 family)
MKKQLGILVVAGGAALIGGALLASVALGDDDYSAGRQSAFLQTNLVSNLSTVGAAVVDPHVENPWGMASGLGGPLWVANNGAAASTVYTLQNEVPMIQPLVVTLAATDNPTAWAPTGLVFNPNSASQFMFKGDKATAGAVFIFASEDGRIAAWNPAANGTNNIATTVVTTPNAVYKGLALATNANGNFLFATNFHAGTVEAFGTDFKPATQFKFVDRSIPSGFAPFGIQNINGELFVTFAKQDADKHDDVAGPGNGFVDVFTTEGVLVRRLVSRGVLNSPWGIARAPIGFGQFGGAILVGDFGDGKINAFDNNGSFLGTLRGRNNQPIVINGLWTVMFGQFQGASPEDLYFSAGINAEQNGLIGELSLITRGH